MLQQIENQTPIAATPETWSGPATQQLSLDKSVYIRDDLRPIAVEQFVDKNDQPVTMPVLASIETESGATVKLLQWTENDRDGLTFAETREREDGLQDVISHTVAPKQVAKKDQWKGLQHTVTDPETGHVTTVCLERGGDKGTYTWKLGTTTRTMHKAGVAMEILPSHGRLTIHAEQATSRKGRNEREIEFRRRHWQERRTIAKKVVAGVLAVKATLGTGDLIDIVGDGFNNAHDTVYSAVATPKHTVIKPTDTLDGIPYSQYGLATLRADQRHDDRFYKKQVTARNTIAKVMDQLDGHDYGKVRAEAQNYVAKQPHNLLSKTELKRFKEHIQSADDAQQVATALNDFAKTFGLTAGLQTEDNDYLKAFKSSTDLDDLKTTATNVITALGWLPKNLVKRAALRSIQIGSYASGKPGGVQGEYDSAEETMFIPVNDNTATKVLTTLQDPITSEDSSQVWNIEHELGHAMDVTDEDLLANDSFDAAKMSPNDQFKDQALQTFWSTVVDSPTAVTSYARSNPAENYAEDVAAILTPTDVGLAHPDDWRRYNSKANKQLLRILDRMEQDDPGITAYIVAHNPNLVPN